jgi:hypothetical protein
MRKELVADRGSDASEKMQPRTVAKKQPSGENRQSELCLSACENSMAVERVVGVLPTVGNG